MLLNQYNPHDYIVIDRTEIPWAYTDQKKLVLIKTFAPLSGKVILEPGLSEFPLRVEKTFS